MFIDRVLPSATWTLAIANMLVVAWGYDGPAFWAAMAVVVVTAVGSAWLFGMLVRVMRTEREGADHMVRPLVSRSKRLAYHAMLFVWMLAPTWRLVPPMPWWQKEVVVEPPLEPPPPAIGRSATPLSIPGPARGADVPANVVELIGRAQALLQGTHLNVDSCTGTWGDGQGEAQCLCDYKIAVTDHTGDISVVEVHEDGTSVPDGYTVLSSAKGRACGTNPDLTVNHPPGQLVLAVRTVVKTGGRRSFSVEPAVFTPFSDELDIPELREAGLTYWWEKVQQAKSELVRKDVKSQFFRDRLVTDAIGADHVFLLGVVENVGSLAPFYRTDADAKRLRELRAVLMLFGANGENTFDWRVSSARARGPVQVIPGTYAGLVTNYPRARLMSNHETGTADHLNAAQMAFLHGDEEWRFVKEPEHRSFLLKNDYPMRWFMAAGYNCNAGKIDGFIHACGADWMSAECLATCNHGETYGYLKKYQAADAAFFDPIENERLRAAFALAE